MDFSKKPHHENYRKEANFLSVLFMLWTVPLLWKGFKNGLTTKDITKCLEEDKSDALGNNLEGKWQQELELATKYERKPKLWRALLRIHALKIALVGFAEFSDIMMRTLLALILAQLLIQFRKPIVFQNINTNVTIPVNSTELQENDNYYSDLPQVLHHVWNDKFSLATMLVVMSLISILIMRHCLLTSNLLGIRMRASCCSLLYRKSIHLSASAASKTGTGHLVNLMSNDAARLDQAISFIHYIWILPIQSIIVAYLIWQQAGLVGIIGVACLLLKTVPVQTYLGRYKMILRKKIASRTDERIRIVNEIVQGIQVIKMYAWEIPFQKFVAEARRIEVQQIRCVSFLHGISISALYFVGRSTLFISIMVLFLSGQNISAEIVFPMTQYFLILQLNASFCYPNALSFGGQALVSLKRMEDFLLKEEKNEIEIDVLYKSSNKRKDEKENAVEMNEVSASWDDSSTETLNEIDIQIKSGQLCAIVGPVGGGKSSLIQLLLGELPVKSGQVTMNGSISYAAQEPWIFCGTVRNNILFGESYDKKRYNDVVKCCTLTKDFEQLPNGDKTFVGDRGASLSGGQRARISLARAMYKTATIYLLDDPLSAVDAHVGKHLFDEVIGPRARIAEDATRILVTHQVHLLKEADVIVIVENGRFTHRGTYAELSAKDIDFAKLLHEHKEDDNKHEELNDEILNESGQVYEVDRYENEPDNKSNGLQYKQLKLRTESISKSSIGSQEFDSTQIKEEEQVDGSFSWETFSYYFSIGSNRCQIIFLILVLVWTQCILGGTDYFVKFLTQLELEKDIDSDGLWNQAGYLLVYGALIIVLIFICIFGEILISRTCVRSSKALHDKMFSSILNAPMRFFDSNSSGRILNRISTDMGSVDEILPPILMGVIRCHSDTCGILVVIMIVNPKMIVNVVVSIVLIALIYKFHLRPLQDLKRLEGIHRSPVFSHLIATINGLSTIRARKIQKTLCREFDELQNVYNSVSQLSLSSTQSFATWIELVSLSFLACVTYSFVCFYDDDSFNGNVGLSISQALMLTGMLQFGILQLTEAMQQMISVERIVQYIKLEPERSPSKEPPTDWPSRGNVKFHQMSLRYDPEGEPILKNISLEIKSGSKIGVVGRTGAGKSSLIAALFRLTHIEGLIEIDGINTDDISLARLRSKISIIPQNPVLFSGTLRKNLDPLGKYSDDDIWKAIENVQMKDVISLADGLNMPVMSNGSNFSVGQRQLLCLARAILQKNRILVLDEATANVDLLTDQLIQQTIREKFADGTVVTIAHRLHTIIDSDRILVMEAGNCVEFDTPINLLSIDNGIFKGMVKELGDEEYDRFYKVAK